jgi:hypothetical protein
MTTEETKKAECERRLNLIWCLAARALGGKEDPVTIDWNENTGTVGVMNDVTPCAVCGSECGSECTYVSWATGHNGIDVMPGVGRELIGRFCQDCLGLVFKHYRAFVAEMRSALYRRYVLKVSRDHELGFVRQFFCTTGIMPSELVEILLAYSGSVFDATNVDYVVKDGRVMVIRTPLLECPSYIKSCIKSWRASLNKS